jgi:hypothetical protein
VLPVAHHLVDHLLQARRADAATVLELHLKAARPCPIQRIDGGGNANGSLL